jgi:hypothetical protein
MKERLYKMAHEKKLRNIGRVEASALAANTALVQMADALHMLGMLEDSAHIGQAADDVIRIKNAVQASIAALTQE